MKIYYAPPFARQLKAMPVDLQEESLEKIDLFRNIQNHKKLKVHKLHGPLAHRYSFSVNYDVRIVFKYVSGKSEVLFTAIGDHEIYK